VRRLSLGLGALVVVVVVPLWQASGPAVAGSQLELLAFLDLAEPALEGRGSRSQAVFLRSMATQHPRLRLVLVDVSGQDARERRNRVADWHLDGLGVTPLAELDGPARGWFSGRAPETLLLRPPDTVLRRWVGFASAATLDLALREAASPRRARPGG
jgi:hypothetical protein